MNSEQFQALISKIPTPHEEITKDFYKIMNNELREKEKELVQFEILQKQLTRQIKLFYAFRKKFNEFPSVPYMKEYTSKCQLLQIITIYKKLCESLFIISKSPFPHFQKFLSLAVKTLSPYSFLKMNNISLSDRAKILYESLLASQLALQVKKENK